MSKIGNVIKMFLILKGKKRVQMKELVEKLEVKKDQIRIYKNALDDAGIFIESIRGPDGGYELQNGYDYLKLLNISDSEYIALQLAKTQLESEKFIYISEFNSLYEKLKGIKEESNKSILEDVFFKDINAIGESKNQITDLNLVILSRQKIKIRYYSLKSDKTTNRIVHPYSFINYKGAYYLIAYCENRNKILDFKLSRIENYEILKETFEINSEFIFKDYVNYFGIYKDGENIEVKLKIEMPMSKIVSEKQWIENQKITWNEDKSIIFEAETKGKTELISWILSMGSKIKVLEPEELKNDVENEIKKMCKNY